MSGRLFVIDAGTEWNKVEPIAERTDFSPTKRFFQAIQVVPWVSAFETLMGAYEYFIPRHENTRTKNDVVCWGWP